LKANESEEEFPWKISETMYKQNYEKALNNYRAKNPKLTEVNKANKYVICGLCGGSLLTEETNSHMKLHELLPPSNLTYQLCLPFRVINGKINKGLTFVKLLSIVNNRGFSVPYNGLNLDNWQKLTDCNDSTIRYSKKQRKFIRTLFFALLIVLTQIN
jgi:hypothetical protein